MMANVAPTPKAVAIVLVLRGLPIKPMSVAAT